MRDSRVEAESPPTWVSSMHVGESHARVMRLNFCDNNFVERMTLLCTCGTCNLTDFFVLHSFKLWTPQLEDAIRFLTRSSPHLVIDTNTYTSAQLDLGLLSTQHSTTAYCKAPFIVKVTPVPNNSTTTRQHHQSTISRCEYEIRLGSNHHCNRSRNSLFHSLCTYRQECAQQG